MYTHRCIFRCIYTCIFPTLARIGSSDAVSFPPSGWDCPDPCDLDNDGPPWLIRPCRDIRLTALFIGDVFLVMFKHRHWWAHIAGVGWWWKKGCFIRQRPKLKAYSPSFVNNALGSDGLTFRIMLLTYLFGGFLCRLFFFFLNGPPHSLKHSCRGNLHGYEHRTECREKKSLVAWKGLKKGSFVVSGYLIIRKGWVIHISPLSPFIPNKICCVL